jgi:hypothetical protein
MNKMRNQFEQMVNGRKAGKKLGEREWEREAAPFRIV